jgi:hypothetical protein
MNSIQKDPGRERGSVILLVMLILALLTIIGISAANMSTTEIKIAANDKNYKMAFYYAESGIFGTAKWIGQVVEGNEVPAAGVGNRFSYLDEDVSGNDDLQQLLHEAMGYASAYDQADDLQFAMSSPITPGTVGVDFNRRKSIPLAGSSNKFATGASGVGVNNAIQMPYIISSNSNADNNASAEVIATYMKINGVGGL